MAETIGKYRVIERIGRGGMGTVFKAHDPVLDRFVALKVLEGHVQITDESRARFFREAKACARLSHPNIVTVYDMGEDDGRLYIVMELLEGEELGRLIRAREGLALEDKVSIMAQVCDALHYAHARGIVHRDVKPANILVLRDGRVKLVDFGIAQIADTGALTRSGLILGTLRYMAPEQIRGQADTRSDIFSLGAVCYELMASKPAFDGTYAIEVIEQLRAAKPEPLLQIDPAIPPELVAVVERAMRKDPEDRFADLAHMRQGLEPLQMRFADETRLLRHRVEAQRRRLLELRAELSARVASSEAVDVPPPLEERARVSTLRAMEVDYGARIKSLEARLPAGEPIVPRTGHAEPQGVGDSHSTSAALETIVTDPPADARASPAPETGATRTEVVRLVETADDVIERTIPVASVSDRLETRPAAVEAEPVRVAIAAPPRPNVVAGPRRGARSRTALAVTGLAVAILAVSLTTPWRRPAPPVPPPSPQPPFERPTVPAEAPRRVEAAFLLHRVGERIAFATSPRDQEAERGESKRVQRADAERFRTASQRARQDAERAGAPRLATAAFAAAAEKESRAVAAIDAQDYQAAGSWFREAEQGYRGALAAAVTEGQAEERRQKDEQRRQAQSLVEQSRDRASARRQEALGLEAERLAKDVLDRAHAKQAEADQLVTSQSFAAAAQAYQDAATLYVEATARAQAMRQARSQADGARDRMLAEKQKADQSSSAFGTAVGEERQGQAAYERLAYGQATEKFKAAEALFARATARPAPPAKADPPAAPQAPPQAQPRQPAQPRTLPTF
jgi:serine/threonine protein kinase